MRVIDVEATLALPRWRHCSRGVVNLNADIVTIDIGDFGDGTVPAGVAVASWRWDLNSERTMSQQNISTLLLKCKKKGHAFLAADFVSIDQEGGDLMRHVIDFSALYEVAPVVTAYGAVGAGLGSSLPRAWILSEFGRYGPRTKLEDVLDFDGFLGKHAPRTLAHAQVALEPLGVNVAGFSFVLTLLDFPFALVAAVLSILWLLVMDVLSLLRFGGRARRFYSDAAKAERVRQFNVSLRRPFDAFAMTVFVRGPVEVFLCLLWFTGFNSWRISRLLSRPLRLDPGRALSVLQLRCRRHASPARYFGDLLHTAANWSRNIPQDGLEFADPAEKSLLNFAFSKCYGQALGKGLQDCLQCRLRAVVVLVVLQSCMRSIMWARKHKGRGDPREKPPGVGSVSTDDEAYNIFQGGAAGAEDIMNENYFFSCWVRHARAHRTHAEPLSPWVGVGFVDLAAFGIEAARLEINVDNVSVTPLGQGKTVAVPEWQRMPDGEIVAVIGPEGTQNMVMAPQTHAQRLQQVVTDAVEALRMCSCCNSVAV